MAGSKRVKADAPSRAPKRATTKRAAPDRSGWDPKWKSATNELRKRPLFTTTLARETIERIDELAATWDVSRGAVVERLVEEHDRRGG